MGTEKMKLVCEKTVNGVQQVVMITTSTGNQGQYVAIIVGAGNPFYMWNAITLPPGEKVIGCDFTNAPIATASATDNNALIAQISVEPEDVLTFGPA